MATMQDKVLIDSGPRSNVEAQGSNKLPGGGGKRARVLPPPLNPEYVGLTRSGNPANQSLYLIFSSLC